MWGGELTDAAEQFAAVAAEAEAAHDIMWAEMNMASLAYALSYLGRTDEAGEAVTRAVELGTDIGGLQLGHGYAAQSIVALSRGDARLASRR